MHHPSRVVAAFRRSKTQVAMCVCCGWTWLMCCCVGLSCLIPGKEQETVVDAMRAVIDWYTTKTLDALAPLVSAQHELFLTACANVNARVTNGEIFPKVNLIDAICASDAALGAVIGAATARRVGACLANIMDPRAKQAKTAYLQEVHKQYMKLGGNPAVVLFGLPEYLAIVYDPTCTIMIRCYTDLVAATQLSRTVGSYRARAGF